MTEHSLTLISLLFLPFFQKTLQRQNIWQAAVLKECPGAAFDLIGIIGLSLHTLYSSLSHAAFLESVLEASKMTPPSIYAGDSEMNNV